MDITAHWTYGIVTSFKTQVSNTECGGEGWDWVDALDDVCEPPDENGIFYKGKPLPTVVHYCQFFIAGEMAFGKRRVPHDIFTCESPLLLEPSSALAEAGYKLGNFHCHFLSSFSDFAFMPSYFMFNSMNFKFQM